ncbi:DUF86 domain-containing protein [candidate division TA06 bacterium]|uniref:DUF86 domain-containing protein n=1 Tax=candidate division TA06 bacterium TaxID=2250710 RepID=A0A933IAG8_UNCT6|nr:DUF86 domain-containing protein [candidate division TA06 bacterium]
MKRRSKLFVSDILENMRLAENIVADIDFETFVLLQEKHYTVIRCIEIIGEAVKNLPPELRRKYPDIPWKEMAGMRDTVIHFYMGVDYGIVWNTIKNEYPVVRPRIERIFGELEE